MSAIGPKRTFLVAPHMSALYLRLEYLKLIRELNDRCEGLRVARHSLIRYDFDHDFQLGDRSSLPIIPVAYLYGSAQDLGKRRDEIF
jgi:hypothetical protein